MGFPRKEGYAYYPVTVEPATDDASVWDLESAIDRHIAASLFPRIRELADCHYCIRPFVEAGPQVRHPRYVKLHLLDRK